MLTPIISLLPLFYMLDSSQLSALKEPHHLPTIVPQVVQILPHMTPAYTQGLLWTNGSLYESIGLYGQSEIRQIDAHTGALQERRYNDEREFAEGLALQGNTLIQLTWREGYARRFTLSELKPIEPHWTFSSEGWGLTWMSDKNLFVRSNGSSILHFHDATNFSQVSTLEVRSNGVPVPLLNELEYAKGFIYANVYGVSDEARRILKIDPLSGEVKALVDLHALCEKEKVTYHRELNGIAYNPVLDLFYITGKNWQFIYALRW